jgi:hypothetical protein
MMPDLFAEMFEDFKDSEKREFFVIPSRKISFNATDYVAYYQDGCMKRKRREEKEED